MEACISSSPAKTRAVFALAQSIFPPVHLQLKADLITKYGRGRILCAWLISDYEVCMERIGFCYERKLEYSKESHRSWLEYWLTRLGKLKMFDLKTASLKCCFRLNLRSCISATFNTWLIKNGEEPRALLRRKHQKSHSERIRNARCTLLTELK